MAVQIRLLGEFELFFGSSVMISARKARALLAYLAVRAGRPQQRDHLAHLLWGDVSADDHARKSLRQALTVLRRDLPESLIQATRDELWLEREHADIDVLKFEHLVRPGAAPAELEQAACLYRGELLEGFRSRAGAFDDWLASERQRLRERVVTALGQLLELQCEERDYPAATESAIRMISLDPLHEQAHRALMRLYAQQGRLGDALDQYDNCRQVLERELGHGPAPETAELLETLRNARLVVSQPAKAEPADSMAELRVIAVLGVRHLDSMAGNPELSQTIIEQGGSVLRRTSHRTLGVFGALRSQGSEAARAVSAALGLVRKQPGAFGLGVAYAQAMVTRSGGELVAVGDVVSQAADFAALAEPDNIVVSESVRQALSSNPASRQWRLAPLPRASGQPKAWWVSEVAGKDRGGAEASRPFVGRARETGVLRAVVTSCQSARSGQLIVIRGEPGIGKTRLVEQTIAMAEGAGYRVYRGSAVDFGPRSERDVVLQLARSVLDQRFSSDPRAVFAQAEEPVEPVSTRDRSLLLQLAGFQAAASPEATDQSEREAREERQRQLWLELWQEETRQAPTLICIEDLHWADEEALDHLILLLGLTQHHPLLLLVSTRPEGQPEHAHWLGAMRGHPVISLDLGPLGAAEARQLAHELSITDPLQIQAALDRSGGHPLFLEQILRAGRSVELTESVHDSVQTRLDQLAASEAAALRAASVLGVQFEVGTLSEVTEADVPLEGLLRSGLLRGDAGRLLFAHVLIRDAVYESLLPTKKRLLHARAARAVRPIDPALAAEHLARAEDPAAAEGYLEAACHADARDRVSEALQLAERGLSLVTDSASNFELTRLRAQLLQRLGRREAAEQAARDALAIAVTSAHQAGAWVTLAECLRGTPRDDEALQALQAAEQAAAASDHTTLSQIQYLRGSVLFPRARTDECLAAHQQALRHSTLAGSAEAEARALSGIGDAYYIKGDMQQARSHFERCIALADQLGLVRLARVNRVMLQLVKIFLLEQPRAAVNLILQHAQAAREELDLPGEAVARSSALLALLVFDDSEQLELVARQTVEAARRSGRQRLGLAAAACLVEAQRARGSSVDHERELDAIYQRCAGTDVAFAALNVLGAMIAASADAQRRARLFDEADRIIASGQFVSHGMYQFSRYALTACLEARDLERVEHYASTLEAFTKPYGVRWGTFFSSWARALAGWQGRQRDEHLQQTLVSLEDMATRTGLVREASRIRSALTQR